MVPVFLQAFLFIFLMLCHNLGVARITPIPAREKEICERLRLARLATGLSQVAFARQMGIDSSRLSSYEHARVPVRFGVALAASLAALKSLEWLATGLEARELDYSRYEELHQNIAPNELFSTAYDQQIKPFLDTHWRKPRTLTGGALDDATPEKMSRLFARIDGQPPTPEEVLALRGRTREDAIYSAPSQLLQELYGRLTLTVKQFQRTHLAAIQAHTRTAAKPPTIQPIISDIGNNKMPGFLKRLKEATAARGQKTILANDLGVSLARVSQWLSDERNPDGENTLRLLQWIEQHGPKKRKAT